MSGICAVWHKQNPGIVAGALQAAGVRLAANGGTRTIREIAQPAGMTVEKRFDSQQIARTSRLLLACDADLLNRRELAADLGWLEERSDAALLSALYERDGDRFVEKLRGGFALVLWDVREHRLVAAIDGFGIKRLTWHEGPELLVVGSRADAVAAAAGSTAINPTAIANLLNFSANLAPETAFAGVRRLTPGTLLTSSNRGARTCIYWDMRYDAVVGIGEGRLAGELESVVERSVASHGQDEPSPGLGAFLSGGTDSSTIVGLLTRISGSPARAFSIGFEEPGFNELRYAEIAAKKFGAEHHTYLVSAADCAEALDGIVRCFDEPYGNSSAIATYFCARLAADCGVRTLLAGDGGDELFGGNERYATDRIFQAYTAIPAVLRERVIEPFAALPTDFAPVRKARGYIRRAKMPGVERMLSYQFLRTHAPADVFAGDFLQSLGPYSVLDIPARHYANATARDHLDRLLYVDMKITLADNDLPKVTCMSALAGIRVRFPYLDRSVADFAGSIPPRLKVKGLQKRYLFKRAFRAVLPQQIIQKKKHGFGIPVALWMKSDRRLRELTHDTLQSRRFAERGYFRRDFVDELFRRHQDGDAIYYGDTLWAFLMLELWHRNVVDEPARALA